MAPSLREIGSLALVLVAGVVVVATTASRQAPDPSDAVMSGSNTRAAPVSSSPASAGASSTKPPASANSAATVGSASPSIRGCQIEDHGWGSYAAPWRTLGTVNARLMVPKSMPDATYDLLLHFHGGEAVRKLVAPTGLRLALATVDAGQGSKAYADAMHDPKVIDTLLARVDDVFSPAKRRHLLLSSWSAGYAAIREILRQKPELAQAVLVLDGVHASYTDDGATLRESDIKPFSDLAKRARDDHTLLLLTHSEIRPPGYASTKRVADHLLDGLGARRRYAGLVAVQPGVRLKTQYTTGKLTIRGYTGSDRHAHCAQLALLPEVLETLVVPALKSRSTALD